ncbi:MAG: T9SS type A sorting domain-containing protein [Bacteroidia bacterium]
MKFIKLLAFVFLTLFGYTQQISFAYGVSLKPITITNLPGVHSFAFAQSNDKWLIVGGRLDGLHARQPFNAFPASSNNNNLYVVDVALGQFWSAPLTSLSVSIQEQLQSTNMNFYQDNDTLYIIGGYGYSNTSLDHITYPNLTSIHVSGLISAIISNSSITPFIKQITHQNFAVNGGQLGKIGDTFYLVGGHRFDGRYNPMGNPTYTQTYVSGIKTFKLNNSGSLPSFSNYNLISDQVHLHRRDYNLLPFVYQNGELGYLISSGVFQNSVNLPFLYPVEIKSSGYTPITSFNQYLSNYHSAKVSLFDSVANTMHSVFFGGMSQYKYVNSAMVQDNNVPFVKTISRISKDGNGNWQENVFANEMPSLIGASAEFVPNHHLAHYKNEVLKMNSFTTDSIKIGHILGGIFSPQENPFTNNQTSVTNAHPTIYEVWLKKESGATSIKPVNGENPLNAKIYPNPVKSKIEAIVNLPEDGTVYVMVTDNLGKLVHEDRYDDLGKGQNQLIIDRDKQLSNGVYYVNFNFKGLYYYTEKIILSR